MFVRPYLSTALLLLVLGTITPALATTGLTIWFTPQLTNWPVILSAIVDRSKLKLSSSATFSWSFTGDPSQACTIAGKSNVAPCVGQTVDHVFSTAGLHNVTLTVADAGHTVATAAASVPVGHRIAAAAPRPEIRQISDAYWTKLVNAFYFMKANGIYDHLGRIHSTSFTSGVDSRSGGRGVAHGGPAFPMWHRMFTMVVERAVQVAAGDDNFGLPYWDWSNGANLQSLVFSDKRF
jgi:hypothetical protein